MAQRFLARALSALLTFFSVFAVASLGGGVCATEPPTADQLKELKDKGILEERLARAEQFGMYRFSEGLAQKTLRKVRIESLRAATGSAELPAWGPAGGPLAAFPFTTPPELRSRGRVRTVTLLVDFKDLKAEEDSTVAGIGVAEFQANVYGDGTSAAQTHKPYESLRNYYRRASHYEEDGQGDVISGVDIDGEVLGWCTLPNNRNDYRPTSPGEFAWNRALFKLAVEAMRLQDADHDFAQYDNDNDGDIDLVTIIYAGPPGEWMDFWWAYRWEFFIPEAADTRFDGKRLRQFVFQFAKKREGDDFDPTTLIHETGHAFGLPDYYDYEPGYPNAGVDGGVGGLDMMDANRGNHNAFSRWALDWIDIETIGSARPAGKTLYAGGSSQRSVAVAVFPGLESAPAPNQEMFIIENRHQLGNDSQMPGSGILVWHVDATPKPDNTNFLYDNSYTGTKLLRLMRPGKSRDFARREQAKGESYYNHGERFTPDSVPNSGDNQGNPTGVSLSDISEDGEKVTARIGIEPGIVGAPPVAATAARAAPRGTDETTEALSERERKKPADALDVAAARDRRIDFASVESFIDKAQRATKEELEEEWNKAYDAKRLQGPPDQSLVLQQVLLTQLAAKDGNAAIAIVESLPKGTFRSQVFPLVMEAWANNDPKGAAKWYLDPTQSKVRTEARAKDDGQTTAGMQRFAKTVYEWAAMNDPKRAVLTIDKLEHPAEIDGAIQGVLKAQARVEFDDDKIEAGVEELKQNRGVAEAVLRIQRADQLIEDPKQRADFKRFMQERGSR